MSEPLEAPVAEPVAAPVSEPVVAPVSEPVVAPVSEPVAAPVAEPVEAPADLGLDLAFAMPERPFRIGCVGFGGIARHAHAPAYRAMGWPVVAVADIDPAARACTRDEFGIERTYADWRDRKSVV